MTLGWREWISLPGLDLDWIKCKVDTGARSSSLHAFSVERFSERGHDQVRFLIHPLQRDTTIVREYVLDVVDERVVTDSGGHRERRCFVRTPVRIGPHEWPVELSLTERDTMRFRMLLGRTAIAGRMQVDPGASYLSRRRPRRNQVIKSLTQ